MIVFDLLGKLVFILSSSLKTDLGESLSVRPRGFSKVARVRLNHKIAVRYPHYE